MEVKILEEITEKSDMGPMEPKKSNKVKIIVTVVITLLALTIAVFAMKIAPFYQKEGTEDMINLIINNNNVTAKMKNEVYIDDNGVIYLSKDDVKNYFDKYIKYYETEKRLVTTYEDKIASVIGNDKFMEVNGQQVNIKASIITKNGIMYIPFSEMCKNVYNANLTYINEEDNKAVIVDSISREVKESTVKKNVSVKYKAKVLSRTLEKLKKGDKVTYISDYEDWSRVRTSNGKIGYIKKSDIEETKVVRQAIEEKAPVEGKINLVWDYYSEYNKAPDRTNEKIQGVNVVSPSFFYLEKGTGNVKENVGQAGEKYVQWAHDNGYQVWAMFSNNSLRETTSTVLESYETRKRVIDNIVELVKQYNVDGLNLDFENLNMADKSNYSRLVIELEPRLKAAGKVFSVDVTAPDGSENWSLCFDRNVIGHVADYIVFMGYDEHGVSSKAGTVAGYNWVKTNVNKFINQEVIKSEKIILGVPFYTRLWTIKEDSLNDPSSVVNIKDVDTVIAGKGEKEWKEDVRQYYIEYKEGKSNKVMWIEDERSIKEKLGLVNEYNLAGVAFWAKDREPDTIWQMIDEELNK